MLSIRRQVYVLSLLILMSKLFSTFAEMKLAVRTILPAGKTHSGTVIFFHGSGKQLFIYLFFFFSLADIDQ